MKTSFYAYKLFLKIYKLKILREPYFKQNLMVRLIVGLLFLVSLLNIVFLGYYFKQILIEIKIPNPTEFFISKLLFYMILFWGIKIIFSKPKLFEARKFVLLPYPKKYFLNIAIVQFLFSFSTIIVSCFLFSFFLSSIYKYYSLIIYFVLTFKIILIVLLFELIRLIILFSKHIFTTKIISISFIISIIFVDNAFQQSVLKLISNDIFSIYFNTVQIILIFSLIILIVFYYKLALRRIEKYLRNEYSYSKKILQPLKFRSTRKIRNFIALEIKQIIRNKGTLIFIINSFSLFLLGVIGNFFLFKQNTISPILFFTCFFSLGVYFPLTYGINTFNWQRNYLSVIFVSNIDLSSFIKAKIILFFLLNVLFFVITVIPFFYLSPKLTIYYVILFLYYLPLSSFFVLYLANFNITTLSLNKLNNSNISVAAIILTFISFYPLLVTSISLMSKVTLHKYLLYFFIVVGVPEIVNLLFFKKWYLAIYRKFLNNKYNFLTNSES